MKHVIVSRVNIPRELDPSNHRLPQPYKDPLWNKKRVNLLNKFTRASLSQQTCQDFTFFTLWGNYVPEDRNNRLRNEVQATVLRGLDIEDEKPFDFKTWRETGEKVKEEMDFAFQIRDIMRRYFPMPQEPILFTNIDCDDCLHYKFVERIQDIARDLFDSAPVYIDVPVRYMLHVDSGGQGKKPRKSPSPMVSTLEPPDDIQCYPLKYHHSMLRDHLTGMQFNELKAMQTITDTNILQQGTGDDAHFNTEDYFPEDYNYDRI